MPAWVDAGYREYAQRMTGQCSLVLREVSAEKRTKNSDTVRICEKESQKLFDAVPANTHRIALDVEGKSWSTEQLAKQMENWMMSGQDVSLFVGGPEGLSSSVLGRVDQKWSLSPLTFPHPLVRVVVAEQLYRAWSLTQNHPYHRAG